MPRRPSDSDDDISLFPFLSIIACVIGVLTMMISTLALAQMDTPDVALIEAHEVVSKELSDAQKEVAELQSLIEEKLGPDAAQVQKSLATGEKELADLLKQLKEVKKQLEESKKVKVVIPTLDPSQRESVASMQSELTELEEELAQLEKELSEREEAGQTKTSILPSGTGVKFKPHFVECANGAVVLHTMNPPKTIRAANMVNDKDFIALLERVANGVDDTIIFLIRSEGLNTYYAARQICRDREIRNGKLPVIGNGRIDLSAFVK